MIAGLPTFDGLAKLTDDQLRQLMPVKRDTGQEAKIERALRDLFLYAIQIRASDVHIQGRGDESKTDVVLSVRGPSGLENFSYVGQSGRHFLSKMFALTNTPQGGSTLPMISTRFSMELPWQFATEIGLIPRGEHPYEVDLRVEYIRTFDGWSLTSRILDQQRTPAINELGMSRALEAVMRRVITVPSGLILVSGPTGSGKSTALQAFLSALNDGQRIIKTIEDPVEYRLRSSATLAQIPVGGGITFPSALRSVLRQDPDVIMIGEIRDEETMEIALAAAQTGHLVLSTIHANSAADTVTRALELTRTKGGRDAQVLAVTLQFVLSQRLIETYAGDAVERQLQPGELAWLHANGMGFMTRIREVVSDRKSKREPVMEGIEITPEIRQLIGSDSLSSAAIYRLARNQPHYETLAMAGVRAVESKGTKLSDCMLRLETTSEAQLHPGMRLQIARAQCATLSAVSQVIDSRLDGNQRNAWSSTDEWSASIAETEWETA